MRKALAMILIDSTADLAVRLGVATVAGLLLGLEREIHGHDAGLRTHALVALSSALIMVSSLMLYDQLKADGAFPDPLRAIQGLAQAIGFIAAGLIFVQRGGVRNLTTAANLWVAAAIGIAAGAGQYVLVALASGLALVVLTLASLLVRWMPKNKSRSKERGAQTASLQPNDPDS